MNKSLLTLSLIPIASVMHTYGTSHVPDNRPNIILFLVDDMGWQDTSLPFWTQRTMYNERYETPNMEKLAQQGMMFTQAYASSISSPTRCSLMTGCNASRHRVTNWTLRKNTKTDAVSNTLEVPDWNYNGIAQVHGTNNTFIATSFVQLLKDNGYHTIHCGKAHWGAIDTPGESPYHCRTCGRWPGNLPERAQLWIRRSRQFYIAVLRPGIRKILGNRHIYDRSSHPRSLKSPR